MCERVISVKPSATPYDGASAFVLTVKFTNNSGEELRLKYDESVLARTFPMILQETSPERWPFRYVNHIVQDNQRRIIKVDAAAVTSDLLLFESPRMPAKYDGYPPSLFMKLLSGWPMVGDPSELSVRSFHAAEGVTWRIRRHPLPT